MGRFQTTELIDEVTISEELHDPSMLDLTPAHGKKIWGPNCTPVKATDPLTDTELALPAFCVLMTIDDHQVEFTFEGRISGEHSIRLSDLTIGPHIGEQEFLGTALMKRALREFLGNIYKAGFATVTCDYERTSGGRSESRWTKTTWNLHEMFASGID